MSERVRYYGITTIEDKETADAFETLCMELGWDTDRNDDLITFYLDNGVRGGGMTCKEILEEQFGEFVENNKLFLEIDCTYLDQAPVITETLGEEE